MYSMSCAPLTCCSMDAATDSETTLALAPGNVAFTVTWGGTTCGYCAIGRPNAASAPDRIMSSAMTVESTGRSMKKLSMVVYFGGLLRRVTYRGQRDGPHGRAGAQLADPLHHHAIAGGEAARDHPLVAEAMAGHDLPRLDLVALGDDKHRLGSLQLLHRLLRDADRLRAVERRDDDAHEQPRAQQALRIGQRDAHLQRAALLVERRVDEIEPPRHRVLRAVRQADAERRRLIGTATRLLHFQQPLLADGEVHPHRVARVQRGEHGLLRRDQ